MIASALLPGLALPAAGLGAQAAEHDGNVAAVRELQRPGEAGLQDRAFLAADLSGLAALAAVVADPPVAVLVADAAPAGQVRHWHAGPAGHLVQLGRHRLGAGTAPLLGGRLDQAVALQLGVDLDARRLHVRGSKTEDSDRIITIDGGTAGVLRAWRKAQLAERLAWGAAWTDSGRVFTREDGEGLRAAYISERFRLLAGKAGLPPVRFHDLRHGAATMLIAAGQPVKVVSAILGHSTSAFTMDVYAVVAEELAEAAATAIAAFVPRRGRKKAAE